MPLTFSFLKQKAVPKTIFGAPYAVINLSKVGLRYFRLFLTVSPKSQKMLVERLVRHPNVGWIFSGEGWFNFGVGVWARDNSEINDLSAAIRDLLGSNDRVVYQSELTSLYGFGNRPIESRAGAMPIIDSTHSPVTLSPTELDYIKLVTLDDSLPVAELARILGSDEASITTLRESLVKKGVIVGTQKRLNYDGFYFKVLINSASRTHTNAAQELWHALWSDPRCIYLAKGNGVYDLEFEVVLADKKQIKQYTQDFSDCQTAVLTENLYTNLYPLGKMASLLNIEDAFAHQQGNIIDFRNSKLWYLRSSAADAYLNIYKNREYFESMEKVELDLFEEITTFIKEKHSAQAYSIIDLGSGNGMKGRIFIEKMGEESVKAYYPVDIQPIELAAALKAHEAGAYSKLPTLLDFENLFARFPLKLSPGEHQVFMLFGGTYGNFEHSVINGYLKVLLSESSTVLVTMPIRNDVRTDEQITASYATKEVERMAVAPLEQVGFTLQDFEPNAAHPEVRVQTRIENGRNVCSYILKNKVEVDGRVFMPDTEFKMLSSWKPTLEQFLDALKLDFMVEHVVKNGAMAIASITPKL